MYKRKHVYNSAERCTQIVSFFFALCILFIPKDLQRERKMWRHETAKKALHNVYIKKQKKRKKGRRNKRARIKFNQNIYIQHRVIQSVEREIIDPNEKWLQIQTQSR